MELQWILLIVFTSDLCKSSANELARGWGDSISWTDLETGLDIAKAQNKPLMLLIHKSWCGACKNLKPKFAESTDIATLSEKFVMVNANDDEEPKGQEFAPDGGYIPRIFFLDPATGEVMTDIYNESGSAQYKYYYPSTDAIVNSMKRVLEKGSKPSAAKSDL